MLVPIGHEVVGIQLANIGQVGKASAMFAHGEIDAITMLRHDGGEGAKLIVGDKVRKAIVGGRPRDPYVSTRQMESWALLRLDRVYAGGYDAVRADPEAMSASQRIPSASA